MLGRHFKAIQMEELDKTDIIDATIFVIGTCWKVSDQAESLPFLLDASSLHEQREISERYIHRQLPILCLDVESN
jgi:hypothetical protein